MKWRNTLFVTYAVISTAFIIAFSYNLLSFARYFDDFLYTNTRNFVYRNDRLFAHIFTALGCLLNFLFVFKKFKYSAQSTFWVLFIPVLFIDLTTFIEGRSLIPLRFPFATLFPLFGLLGGILKISYKKSCFTVFIACFILFTVLSQTYFIPAIIRYMVNRDYNNIPVSPTLLEGKFLTIDGKPITIKDTVTATTTLIEYYFVGCVACENKKPYIAKLLETNKPDKFQVIFVCNGSITDFAKFQKDVTTNRLKSASYLYKRKEEINNKDLPDGYPFEIIINKNFQITSTFEGFNPEAGIMYLKKTQEKIYQAK